MTGRRIARRIASSLTGRGPARSGRHSRRTPRRGTMRPKEDMRSAKKGRTPTRATTRHLPIQRYLPLFSGGASARPSTWLALKSEALPEQQRVLRLVPQKHRDRSLVAAPFPRALSPAHGSLQPFSKSLHNELKWTTASLCTFATHITPFLSLKDRFEHFFLLGDYVSARRFLEDAETLLGQSIWLLESKCLLEEYSGGLKANRVFLKHALPAAMYPFNICLPFLSHRAEQSFSSSTYDARFAALCDSIPTEYSSLADHFRFQLHFTSVADLTALASTLYEHSSYPVVDQYLALLRALHCVSASDLLAGTRSCARSCVKALRAAIQDSRLAVLEQYLFPGSAVASTEYAHSLMLILDLYTRGQYERCLTEGRGALMQYPCALELYELYASATFHLRVPINSPFASGSLAHRVLSVVHDWLGYSDRTPAAAEAMRVIGVALNSFPIGPQLHALAYRGSATVINPRVFGELTRACVTPRFSNALSSSADAALFLSALAALSGPNAAVDLFRERSSPNRIPTLSQVPTPRRLLYQATALCDAGRHPEAVPVFQALLDQGGVVPRARYEATNGLAAAYLAVGDGRSCADLLVNAYLDNKHVVEPELLERLVAHGKVLDGKDAARLSWPLAIFAQADLTGQRDYAELHAAYAAFLAAHGVTRPSKLADDERLFPRPWLTTFLRHICVSDVLEFSVLEFADASEIESERIAVCQRLGVIDSSNAEVYASEIATLTQQRMIARAIEHLEQSKIYVDTDGIRASLGPEVHAEFERYVAFRSLDQGLQEIMRVLAPERLGKLVVATEDVLTIFANLFIHIRQRFTSSNEFGLDSYLSVRIRHGTLSGELRSPFEREHLVTRRTASDGTYARNREWLERAFGGQAPAVERAADDVLRAFSKQVDAIIDKVKRDLIQIRAAACPTGLFDFDYDAAALTTVFLKMNDITTFEEFFSQIMRELWERTESDLVRIRDRLEGEVADELTAAVDQVQAALSEIDANTRGAPLGAALVRARTGVQSAVRNVCNWFRVAGERQWVDFDARLLTDTALEVLRNCFPDKSIEPRVTTNVPEIFRAAYFSSLNDVLFILLENVLKHSGLSAPFPRVELKTDVGRVFIIVANSVAPGLDVEGLRARADKLNVMSRKVRASGAVREEGGSGYYKLHKILWHDLECESDYNVDVSIVDGEFRVTINMRAEGLLR